ncbi:cupin domain-containing protein [Noviluteimonas gilva]|uniref:DUF4437 domain-containing protein n=1 Tax=Noviluteimonas gilva TaxID=2682097 RepID=A0A7C9HXN8_9GAMM|nr:DUF4437 domain-containing protein [Lysobacter gilvus]
MKITDLFALALVPALALAQSASSSHVMVKAADTKWGEGPAFLPKGVQAAVLYGDPSKAGPFTLRLKAPAGGKIPRHWHPTDEQVTIIEGDFHLSMGDAANAHESDFAPGDYVNLPAKMQHEASTKNGAVVQVNAMGPFEINYVDPKDDPRNAGK